MLVPFFLKILVSYPKMHHANLINLLNMFTLPIYMSYQIHHAHHVSFNSKREVLRGEV